MKHQKHLDSDKLRKMLEECFPWRQYRKMRPNQREAFEIIADQGGSVTLELPTGTGKTGVGYTFLETMRKLGYGPLFYLAPVKTLVDQVKSLHPDIRAVYGRSEYQCLYYTNDDFKASDVPCLLLSDCSHRVDQETGETYAAGAAPCPYLHAKYQAKQGGIVACTTAFYLFTQLFSKEWPTPAGLVIDEAHRVAQSVRSILSYEITDYHLGKCAGLLREIGGEEAKTLDTLKKRMVKIVRRKPSSRQTLLEDHEIRELIDVLANINTSGLRQKVKEAVKTGKIDPKKQRETLKRLEVIIHDLHRYLSSFEYSLETDKHKPLNYTYAFYKAEKEENEFAQYRLVIKAYYVAPIIRRMLSPFTVAYSATIGDSDVFGFETGIKAPVYTFKSDFPVENARIYMPSDTPNLAVKERGRQDMTRCLRKIAKVCRQFADKNMRSLVVVVSEKEREKFLFLCGEESVKVVSYGNGVKPKEAARRFKDGEGEVLVGTVANYGEGMDLPKQIAPVIFFLRPSYSSPTDPATQFEERRFGQMRWKLWNWRVMQEALQARGRNIRSADDIGVTILISQQFRRFAFASLPEWLKDAYRGEMNFDQCVSDTLKLLK